MNSKNQKIITFASLKLRLSEQTLLYNLLNPFYLIPDEDIFNQPD